MGCVEGSGELCGRAGDKPSSRKHFSPGRAAAIVIGHNRAMEDLSPRGEQGPLVPRGGGGGGSGGRRGERGSRARTPDGRRRERKPSRERARGDRQNTPTRARPTAGDSLAHPHASETAPPAGVSTSSAHEHLAAELASGCNIAPAAADTAPVQRRAAPLRGPTADLSATGEARTGPPVPPGPSVRALPSKEGKRSPAKARPRSRGRTPERKGRDRQATPVRQRPGED